MLYNTSMLQIYNGLTKRKEIFKPYSPPKVGIYVCGMTTYDYCHIGNARVFVFFDVVVRYLRYLGYQVKYVRNITDIDDKIISRAIQNNENPIHLAQRFIKALQEDEQQLNILLPDIIPLATEHIPQIINLLKLLLERDYAYIAGNGDVYYDVSKFSTYGEFAQQNLDELHAGIRVDVAEGKRNALDFVLWKLAKPNEPAWASPWGKGRPGWHSECVAMAWQHLGGNIDIHGGGIDLRFPHHQNEIAQALAAYNTDFVRHWMHLGFVQVNHAKMAKSAGNFFTVREILTTFSAETLRYFLLSAHYRSSLEYSTTSLLQADDALRRLYTALRDLPLSTTEEGNEPAFSEAFFVAMDDDFNIPKALAALFDLAHEIQRLKTGGNLHEATRVGIKLCKLGKILGLLQNAPEKFLCANINSSDLINIEKLIAEREAARFAKDWFKADAIREQLLKQGIEIEDTKNGAKWHRKIN